VSTVVSLSRGLSLAKTVAQLGAYLLITWTYAERRGLGDRFLDGLLSLLGLPRDLLRAVGRPGGVR
jgi:hypothetical protein